MKKIFTLIAVCALVFSAMADDAVSLNDALDAATEISYADDLPYTDEADHLPILCNEIDNFGNGTRTAYCATYKITLYEGNSIKIHHHAENDAYLYVYIKNGDDYETYKYNDDESDSSDSEVILLAGNGDNTGTYYIVATTYNNNSDESYSFSMTVFEASGVIPLKDALDAATEISYADDLPYTDEADNLPILCNNVPDWNGGLRTAYCATYKITLANGNKIEINHHTGDDALLHVYTKNGDNYAIYKTNDDDDAYTNDSRITLSAGDEEGDDDAGTYYIVATTYESESNESYSFSVNSITTGLDNISSDGNVSVYGANGVISVSGATEGESIVVYNISGVIVAKTVAVDGLTTVNVSNGGVYVVHVGNRVYKLLM